MNKSNEVEVKVAGESKGIRHSVGKAVRAGIALGAAVVVCSAPFVAYAAVPDRMVIDGRDGGIYAEIGGFTPAEVEAYAEASAVANSNFGAQSEYEAYIASISPTNGAEASTSTAPAIVKVEERVYREAGYSAHGTSTSSGASSVANIAPSSAAESNTYSGGTASSKPERVVRVVEGTVVRKNVLRAPYDATASVVVAPEILRGPY